MDYLIYFNFIIAIEIRAYGSTARRRERERESSGNFSDTLPCKSGPIVPLSHNLSFIQILIYAVHDVLPYRFAYKCMRNFLLHRKNYTRVLHKKY